MHRHLGMVLASLAVLSLACASSTPSTRSTRDPSEDPGEDGKRTDAPPAGAGPFQAEEATTKGPPQVVIINGTEEIVNVEFEGPSASKMSITPGDTQAFTSSAGSYSVTLSDPRGAHEATTLAGIALEDDWIYTWVIRMKAPE
jgi:hypothetical protein